MHRLEKRVLLPEDLKPVNSLAEYRARGGLKGLERAATMTPQAIIEEIKKAGLRGRGGAGFPTHLKWQTVFNDPLPSKYVVCNFAEGEPGTFKDRYLVSKNPYLVFEGMLIASLAVGAQEVVIATKEKFTPHVTQIKMVLRELEDEGVVERGFVRIVLGPDEYLLGEEKALVEVIDGGPAMPRNFPPFMNGIHFVTGQNTPTIVNNVESFSHVALILGGGADKWRANGFADTPGTVIMTLSGDLKKPGLYEIPAGITVKDLLYDIGGGPLDGREFKAIFSGVSNRVMTPDQFSLPIGFGTLREAGVGLGSAGFIVYDNTRSMLDMAWMFSHFLAVSSCGQCIPCNAGTKYITEELLKIRNGYGTGEEIENILHETKLCTNQTRCFLPQQITIVVPSLINKFKEEFTNWKGTYHRFNHDVVIPKIQDFDETSG